MTRCGEEKYIANRGLNKSVSAVAVKQMETQVEIDEYRLLETGTRD